MMPQGEAEGEAQVQQRKVLAASTLLFVCCILFSGFVLPVPEHIFSL